MANEVRKDFADGQQAGISGTPGFIVNGKLISGAQPFAAFAQIIEAELN
jgi:protein-disulfide isomerase